MKKLFQILTTILIIVFVDQIYMIKEYGNISKETVFVTFCLLLASIKFVFFDNKNTSRI
ncbi:MAG: hypothetical protein Q4E50_02455 [Tissierellia bacterium]|nr:hypothetical protein [Tissierellia bacterium]